MCYGFYPFSLKAHAKMVGIVNNVFSHLNRNTVFPQIIGRGDYYILFSHKKGAIIWGRRLFQIIAQWRLCPKYFFQIWFLDEFPGLNILGVRAWIVTDHSAGSDSTSSWQGGYKRKRRWREGWRVGDYLREAINQGTAIIQGNTVGLLSSRQYVIISCPHFFPHS